VQTGPFISEQNPTSHRRAVFEDDGISGWLYLTEPESQKPIADSWIYNRVSVKESAEEYMSRGTAPPAPLSYAGPDAEMAADESDFSLLWAGDGESVALFINRSLVGFIVSGGPRGYSRNLVKEGPWGIPLDEELYRTVFERKVD
jgi:hypothetical protein